MTVSAYGGTFYCGRASVDVYPSSGAFTASEGLNECSLFRESGGTLGCACERAKKIITRTFSYVVLVHPAILGIASERLNNVQVVRSTFGGTAVIAGKRLTKRSSTGSDSASGAITPRGRLIKYKLVTECLCILVLLSLFYCGQATQSNLHSMLLVAHLVFLPLRASG